MNTEDKETFRSASVNEKPCQQDGGSAAVATQKCDESNLFTIHSAASTSYPLTAPIVHQTNVPSTVADLQKIPTTNPSSLPHLGHTPSVPASVQSSLEPASLDLNLSTIVSSTNENPSKSSCQVAKIESTDSGCGSKDFKRVDSISQIGSGGKSVAGGKDTKSNTVSIIDDASKTPSSPPSRGVFSDEVHRPPKLCKQLSLYQSIQGKECDSPTSLCIYVAKKTNLSDHIPSDDSQTKRSNNNVQVVTDYETIEEEFFAGLQGCSSKTPPFSNAAHLIRNQSTQTVYTDGMTQLNRLLCTLEKESQWRQRYCSLQKRCDHLEVTKDFFARRSDLLLTACQVNLASEKSPVVDFSNSSQHHRRDRDNSLRDKKLNMESGDAFPYSFTGRGMIDSIEIDTELNLTGDDKHSKWERKKSKKLKAKWEQVKKVFSGKQEPGHKLDRIGTVTAKELLTTNSKGKLRNFSVVESPSSSALEALISYTDQFSPHSPGQANLWKNRGVASNPLPCHTESDERQFRPALKHSNSTGSFVTLDTSNLCQINAIMGLVLESQTSTTPSQQEEYATNETQNRLSPSYTPTVGRSNSFKFQKTISQTNKETLSKSVPSSPVDLVAPSELTIECSLKSQQPQQQQHLPQPRSDSPSAHGSFDAAKKATAAWEKVKDIIHTRKGSFKNNVKSNENETVETGPDNNGEMILPNIPDANRFDGVGRRKLGRTKTADGRLGDEDVLRIKAISRSPMPVRNSPSSNQRRERSASPSALRSGRSQRINVSKRDSAGASVSPPSPGHISTGITFFLNNFISL